MTLLLPPRWNSSFCLGVPQFYAFPLFAGISLYCVRAVVTPGSQATGHYFFCQTGIQTLSLFVSAFVTPSIWLCGWHWYQILLLSSKCPAPFHTLPALSFLSVWTQRALAFHQLLGSFFPFPMIRILVAVRWDNTCWSDFVSTARQNSSIYQSFLFPVVQVWKISAFSSNLLYKVDILMEPACLLSPCLHPHGNLFWHLQKLPSLLSHLFYTLNPSKYFFFRVLVIWLPVQIYSTVFQHRLKIDLGLNNTYNPLWRVWTSNREDRIARQ